MFNPAALAATALYFALTVALTWPLIVHPGSLVPHDPGDPLLNVWIMSWNARVLPLTSAWWNATQFFPAQGATAFSEHLLGLSVLTTPIILISGNPLLAYNVAFFASFVLCAVSAYALTFCIAGRHDAALVAGLAFAFAPYRMSQLAHVQVLSGVLDAARASRPARLFRGPPQSLGGAVRGRVVDAGVDVWLLPVLPVRSRCPVASVVRHWTRTVAAYRTGGAGVGRCCSRDDACALRLLEISACLRDAPVAKRDHRVQRRCGERAESTRRPAPVGMAECRRPSGICAVPGPDDCRSGRGRSDLGLEVPLPANMCAG